MQKSASGSKAHFRNAVHYYDGVNLELDVASELSKYLLPADFPALIKSLMNVEASAQLSTALKVVEVNRQHSIMVERAGWALHSYFSDIEERKGTYFKFITKMKAKGLHGYFKWVLNQSFWKCAHLKPEHEAAALLCNQLKGLLPYPYSYLEGTFEEYLTELARREVHLLKFEAEMRRLKQAGNVRECIRDHLHKRVTRRYRQTASKVQAQRGNYTQTVRQTTSAVQAQRGKCNQTVQAAQLVVIGRKIANYGINIKGR
mmetsp:Transcript_26465/g.47502  ORF Transcript_26465/g.47502 Transcript_26465/m.47502 type:complete len:259 (+) Transcript_26465:871-1647(+)